MKFNLTSQGLTEYERGLIQEQLKVIHGRTRAIWSYIGEGLEGNLIITRSFIEMPEWHLQAVLLSDDQKPLKPEENLLVGEWPLRIVGLMDLLHQAEQRLSVNPEMRCPSAERGRQLPSQLLFSLGQHMQPGQSFLLEAKGQQALVVHHDDGRKTILPAHGPDALILLLLELPPEQIDFKIIKDKEIINREGISLDQFIWQLALQEPVYQQAEWHQPQFSYHIQRWPMLGMWHTEPHMFHLAALFGRTSETLSNAAAAANVPVHMVASFIHACRSVELGVERRENHPRPSISHAHRDESHFLSALREKLGLVFKL